MNFKSTVRTCFWFRKGGLDAARFYVSLLPKSEIEAIYEHGQPDDPMIVEFTLAGAPMMIMTHDYPIEHTPAASISVLTKDQEETDRVWSSLVANGGEESMCGWLKDRHGVSWQIVPEALPKMLGADDPEAAGRARSAMMKMKKFDIAVLEAAFDANY